MMSTRLSLSSRLVFLVFLLVSLPTKVVRGMSMSLRAARFSKHGGNSGSSRKYSSALPSQMAFAPAVQRSSSSAAQKGTNKKSRPYNVPGYEKGDESLLKAVFKAHSMRGRMSYDAFQKSRYLRYWPGKKQEVVRIWCDITEATATDVPLTIDQVPSLLARLDAVAAQTEREMQAERVTWEIEEMSHSYLENFFDRKAARNGSDGGSGGGNPGGMLLSFADFLSFENVQAEMALFGLRERSVAVAWERIAGCVSRGVSKSDFLKIYHLVCGGHKC